MSRKKRRNNQFAQYRFVDITMAAEDRKQFTVWQQEAVDDLDAILGAILTEDYKLSVSYDFEHETFIASMTGRPENTYNAYRVLTARHATAIQAIALVCFKHIVLAQSGDWEVVNPSADWG